MKDFLKRTIKPLLATLALSCAANTNAADLNELATFAKVPFESLQDALNQAVYQQRSLMQLQDQEKQTLVAVS